MALKRFRAGTFELQEDSEVLRKPNGKLIKTWKKGTRFTSYIGHDNWVKATGIIRNQRWNKLSKDYWLNIKTLKRLR